jgi:Chitinase class I
VTSLVIDRDYFVSNFPANSLGSKNLTPSRAEGFNAIFDAWDDIDHYDVLEWLAYILATTWHETGATMLPVRESFAKTDAEAYANVTAYCLKKGISNYAMRHSNGKSYYGRGYVQLTHATNYKGIGERLGVGDELYADPDKVMLPKVAAQIILIGLMEGRFRSAYGNLLSHFDGKKQRWFDARDLVNGDKNSKPKWAGGKKMGTIVGDYGKAFFPALRYK